MVCVHLKALFDQWLKFIAQFLPTAKIGIVKGSKCVFDGCDVVVAMLQSLYSRRDKYPAALWRFPSLLVFDECHRVSAPTFSCVPPLFPARYRLGASATPRRKDGTEKVFRFHLGDTLHTANRPMMVPLVKRVWTQWTVIKTERWDPEAGGSSVLFKLQYKNEKRNAIIVSQLEAALTAGRKVLLLSQRLKHLDLLKASILGRLPDLSIGMCIGGVASEELDEAKKAQLLLATYQFASEGFDVPDLDCLFLAMPIADVKQSAGRALRLVEGKKQPIIVDFRDDRVGTFYRWGLLREKTYKSLGVELGKSVSRLNGG